MHDRGFMPGGAQAPAFRQPGSTQAPNGGQGRPQGYPQGGYSQSRPQGDYAPGRPQGDYAPGRLQGGYPQGRPQGGYPQGRPQGDYAPGRPQGDYAGGRPQPGYGNPGYGRPQGGGYQNRGPQGGHWNQGWRQDQRYDWRGWRDANREVFHGGRYFPPYRGYGYNRLGVGFYLQPLFFGSDYWIDPGYYHLPPAYQPYEWVRYYNDALLVNTYTGQVDDVIYDFFW